MATRTRVRTAPAPSPERPPCAPTGDMRPWPDDRVHTCTRCACIVEVRSNAAGDDWVAIDGAGMAWTRNEILELCQCYPPDSGLRTRGGRIHPQPWDPTAEIDEKPRHYGPGLNLDGPFTHLHDWHGGEVYFTDLRSAHWACGHRPPPQVHTAWIEPLKTDRTPPECCAQPMRFAPRGWQCRVSGAYFIPDLEV